MLPSIFLAIPCYGGVDPRFMGCLLNLVRRLHAMADPPFTLSIEMGIDDSIVGRARNRLVLASFVGNNSSISQLIYTADPDS
jgi:hypothetical protein